MQRITKSAEYPVSLANGFLAWSTLPLHFRYLFIIFERKENTSYIPHQANIYIGVLGLPLMKYTYMYSYKL